MPTLKDIQKRITSVKNTEQITKAMYMVSAAKLRRAQENAEKARPYTEALSATIASLVSRMEMKDHPLLAARDEIKNVEVVLFTSDRGLCGGYNSNLIRLAENFIYENKDKYERIDISVVGKKAADYYKHRKTNLRKTTINLVRTLGIELATSIADELTERYVSGEVDAIYLVYATFKSALTQTPTVLQVLPFEFDDEENARVGAPAPLLSRVDYIYEPSVEGLLEVLLPRQVRTRIYGSMLEAVASEHGARMTAMDSASTNANEMIDHLTLKYNRARQAAITKELMEIIGGAEAIKG